MKLQISAAQKSLCKSLTIFSEKKKLANAIDFIQDMGEKEALTFAINNEVAPILGHYLIDQDHKIWHDSHTKILTILNSYLEELDRISLRFSTENIMLVILKNGGIARAIYPCPGCCPMGDLDTLVEKKDFRRAHQILVEEGYQLEFRSPLEEVNLSAAETSGGAEYWKMLPNGEKLWLELQWRPVAGRWIRPDQEPSAEELISRSISIPGTKVRLLCPEDNLLQVCLHTAKHSYVRAPGFRLHLDVERIVNGQEINWQIFIDQVEKLKVKTSVYFSLAIPKELFSTPVPDEVLTKLRPQKWKEQLIFRMINRAGLFNPPEKKFTRLGYILFNCLLYDNVSDLIRSVFPDIHWMKEHYHFRQTITLPFYYLRRLFDLAFRRTET